MVWHPEAAAQHVPHNSQLPPSRRFASSLTRLSPFCRHYSAASLQFALFAWSTQLRETVRAFMITSKPQAVIQNMTSRPQADCSSTKGPQIESMPSSDRAFSLKPSAWSIDGSKLVLLTVAGTATLAIVGLLGTIAWMSFRTGVPGQDSAYTLSNYRALLTDPYNYRVMVTTLIFAAITIFVSVPLGLVFAWFIERTDMPYKALAMSLLGIGILFPTFLKAMGWVFLLHPRIGEGASKYP